MENRKDMKVNLKVWDSRMTMHLHVHAICLKWEINLKNGDILSWAESSAVVFANSVIGARTNRNSGIIELLCGIVGKVPEFGLLTDEGRRAKSGY